MCFSVIICKSLSYICFVSHLPSRRLDKHICAYGKFRVFMTCIDSGRAWINKGPNQQTSRFISRTGAYPWAFLLIESYLVYTVSMFGNCNLSWLFPQELERVGKPPLSDRWGSSTDEASQRRRGKPLLNASSRTSSQPWRPWQELWPCSESPTPTQRMR